MSFVEEHKVSSIQNICNSTRSLSHYESKKFKMLLPQIIATAVLMCFNTLLGGILGYSAIIVPQILAVQNSTDCNVIKVTKSEVSWIVSSVMLSVPFGSITGSFMMDAIGRLKLLKVATIPMIIGWILLALASNVAMIISGRIITGFAFAWVVNSSVVYISEISRKDVRGSFISAGIVGISIGMILVYVEGWYLDWQVVAGVNIGYSIVFTPILFIIPESPVWLVSKNCGNQARKALEWFHKYQPQPDGKNASFAEMQLVVLETENAIKMKENEQLSQNGIVQKLKMFAQPSGYKPLLIIFGLYFFQQFAGIHVIIFNSVIFFQETGTTIDPYLGTVLLGSIRLLVTICNTVLMKKFNRRSLMMFSGIVMGLFMGISGLYTLKLKNGTSTSSWIPLVSLIIYIIAATMGFMTIPFSFQAEVFPFSIRATANAIASSLSHLLIFGALQCYFPFISLFGGSAGLQFFFAVMSLVGFVFVFVFMPETHNKKVSEIESYFWKHTTYLSVLRHKQETTKIDESNTIV